MYIYQATPDMHIFNLLYIFRYAYIFMYIYVYDILYICIIYICIEYANTIYIYMFMPYT